MKAYLDETKVASPAAGEVYRPNVEPGEIVPAGFPIVTLVDLSDVWVTFQVREDRLEKLKMGATVPARFPALGNEEVPFLRVLPPCGHVLPLPRGDAGRIVPNWQIVDKTWDAYIRVEDADAVYAEVQERGAKIDSLVQVGHACVVGEDNIICAQTGLAGTTILEKNVLLAGQVGVSGHLTIHDNAVVYAQSGVGHDVPVFYGHIHQDNEHVEGTVAQYGARGMMYPLPAPGSLPKKSPMPWDSTQPYRGLGFRVVKVTPTGYVMTEYAANEMTPVISITAKKFAFIPDQVTIKADTPAILELTSLDRQHGFSCSGLMLSAVENPGVITRVRVPPSPAGIYPFNCNIFCGEGHGDMIGNIIIK